MNINFVLTSFSPGMVGEKASLHIRQIPLEEAERLTSDRTKILATRVPHERLARNLFPRCDRELARFIALRDGVNVLFLQYKGPQLGDDGRLPTGSSLTVYLIEVEEYQAPA